MWRGCPRLVGDCREVASQSALNWGLWLCGESVRAWVGTVARWSVSPRLIGDCGYVARQSALGWGLSRGGQSVRRGETGGVREGLARSTESARGVRDNVSPRGDGGTCGVREWMAGPAESAKTGLTLFARGWRD
ncbi:hypothetical protein ACLB2K_008776 [Fragaria x ananassa]